MRVIDARGIFGNDVQYTHSHDKTRVTFRCICGKHSSGYNEYNTSFNLLTGFYYTFGSCGTKFLPFRIQDKITATSRQLEFFRFLRDCGLDPKFRMINDSSITGKKIAKYFWGDFLVQKRIATDSQYLKDRKVPKELIERFEIYHSQDDKEIVFPLTKYNGRKNGVQVRYNTTRKLKYRIVRDERTNISPLHILREYDRSKPLHIVEGMFGMLNLVKHGYQAICVLGKSGLKNEKYLSQFDNVVGCFDNDEAGKEYAKRLLKMRLNSTVTRGAEYDELTSDELSGIMGHQTKFIRGIDSLFNPIIEKQDKLLTDFEDYL